VTLSRREAAFSAHDFAHVKPNFNSFAVNSAATRLQSIDLARHYLLAPDLVK